jgi:hypothetical protein
MKAYLILLRGKAPAQMLSAPSNLLITSGRNLCSSETTAFIVWPVYLAHRTSFTLLYCDALNLCAVVQFPVDELYILEMHVHSMNELPSAVVQYLKILLQHYME